MNGFSLERAKSVQLVQFDHLALLCLSCRAEKPPLQVEYYQSNRSAHAIQATDVVLDVDVVSWQRGHVALVHGCDGHEELGGEQQGSDEVLLVSL